MSRRPHYHHLAWESQPLLHPARPRQGRATRIVAFAFLLGLLIGLFV